MKPQTRFDLGRGMVRTTVYPQTGTEISMGPFKSYQKALDIVDQLISENTKFPSLEKTSINYKQLKKLIKQKMDWASPHAKCGGQCDGNVCIVHDMYITFRSIYLNDIPKMEAKTNADIT